MKSWDRGMFTLCCITSAHSVRIWHLRTASTLPQPISNELKPREGGSVSASCLNVAFLCTTEYKLASRCCDVLAAVFKTIREPIKWIPLHKCLLLVQRHQHYLLFYMEKHFSYTVDLNVYAVFCRELNPFTSLRRSLLPINLFRCETLSGFFFLFSSIKALHFLCCRH